MKKNFLYAMIGAIALTGAVGLSSCSSNEEAVDVNPNYNPETNEVYTQFVFNVATGNRSVTRMSAEATQATDPLPASGFRGIDYAHILCFRQSNDGKALREVTAGTPADGDTPATPGTTADRDFDMSQVVFPGTLSSSTSRRVLEMSLPLNTNTMVFYGRAPINNDKNAYGHLDDTEGYKVSTNMNDVKFQLCRRLSSTLKTKFEETQSLLAAIMSCVMNVNRGNAEVSSSDTPGTKNVETQEVSIPVYGFDLSSDYMPLMPWSAYYNTNYPGKTPTDEAHQISLTPLEEKLANTYKQMTTIQTAELRNGSGVALCKTVQDLWSIVNSVRCAQPTSKPEALAKYMAKLISDELSKYFNYSGLPNDGGSVQGVGFKNAEDLIATLAGDNYWPTEGGAKPSSFSNVTASGSTLGTFPADFDLPQGSTHVHFDSDTKTFSYAQEYNSSASGGGTFTVDDYYYPAELLYFGNSPIRVSDTEHTVNQYPEKTTAWDTEWDPENTSQTAANTPWYGWTKDSHVQSTTRSVAMRNDINYGTALLKTTVGYSDKNKTLKDNNAFIQHTYNSVEEENKEITIGDTSFKLMGVLIGGQSPKVGWNFLPKLTSSDRQGYIYDKSITGNGAIDPTTGSEANYTLVFDNYTSNNTQEKVYVALELQNNTGEAFFGKDNLIPNGANFYLIGELDPNANNSTIDWPTYHALPPYLSGADNHVKRVFIQDYMTTANFKIGEWSLQYAYLTVPDLRSSSVTLGLSVDVKWSTGLVFDNIIVGGNTNLDPNL